MQNPSSNPFLQGIESVTARLGPLVENPGFGFQIVATMTLSAGTMFLMWVGDQITDRGIGNGTSLIITVGIVASLPGALVQVWNTFVPTGGAPSRVSPIVLVLMIAFLVLVVASVIALTQGQRKVSIQYAKRVVGRKVYGGQTQFLPLKVNSVGVMPLDLCPGDPALSFHDPEHGFPKSGMGRNAFQRAGGRFLALCSNRSSDIFLQLFLGGDSVSADSNRGRSKEIQRIHPGVSARETDRRISGVYFDSTDFRRRTLPDSYRGDSGNHDHLAWSSADDRAFFGGTSLLIIVGVLLDTMRQVETHLIQRHYDGFLRKGRIRGRFERAVGGTGKVVKEGVLLWMWLAFALLAVAGVAVSIFVNQR